MWPSLGPRMSVGAARVGTIFRPPGGPPWRGPGPTGLTPESDEQSRADARRHFLEAPRILTPEGKPLRPGSTDTPWDPETVAIAAAGHRRYTTVEIDGDPVRVLSEPIMWGGQVEGVLQSPYPLTELQRFTDSQMRTLGTLLPLALLIAGLGGVFLTDRALRPVRKITQAAAEIGAADLSRRLEVTGQDEFA